MLPIEWAGIFFTSLLLLGCNCAGFGGGGVLTIFLRAFFKFGVKDAIIISNATIAISGLIRYVLNFRKNHPLKVDTNGQPAGLLVDYNVCVVMLPMASLKTLRDLKLKMKEISLNQKRSFVSYPQSISFL